MCELAIGTTGAIIAELARRMHKVAIIAVGAVGEELAVLGRMEEGTIFAFGTVGVVHAALLVMRAAMSGFFLLVAIAFFVVVAVVVPMVLRMAAICIMLVFARAARSGHNSFASFAILTLRSEFYGRYVLVVFCARRRVCGHGGKFSITLGIKFVHSRFAGDGANRRTRAISRGFDFGQSFGG